MKGLIKAIDSNSLLLSGLSKTEPYEKDHCPDTLWTRLVPWPLPWETCSMTDHPVHEGPFGCQDSLLAHIQFVTSLSLFLQSYSPASHPPIYIYSNNGFLHKWVTNMLLPFHLYFWHYLPSSGSLAGLTAASHRVLSQDCRTGKGDWVSQSCTVLQ